MMTEKAIVWFRHDLRLDDHPALYHACLNSSQVRPVYIYDNHDERGQASRWWLHHSLCSLSATLRKHHSRLEIFQAHPVEVLEHLVKEHHISVIYWNKQYDPQSIILETELIKRLTSLDVTYRPFPGNLIFEPGEVLNRKALPFQVFTPFWNSIQKKDSPPSPLPVPVIPKAKGELSPLSVDDLQLLPKKKWYDGLEKAWTPGSQRAEQMLDKFLGQSVFHYDKNRDFPSLEGTSRLSPYLHYGEVSSRRVWHTIKAQLSSPSYTKQQKENSRSFLRQLAWREFSNHLLYHYPQTLESPLRSVYNSFPWEPDNRCLKSWQTGQTGYPLVDAGMRELWHTGWMHNRVRMIAASFLVKHLLQPWQEGASWFHNTLVDADPANNTMGWQWVAGCGADAAPFFRIFNPSTQGKKVDPEGLYVRKWLPELAELPTRWLFSPWEAPEKVLVETGITLGQNYPKPVVDHRMARERCLDAFRRMKKK